jgi:hypothetical protein
VQGRHAGLLPLRRRRAHIEWLIPGARKATAPGKLRWDAKNMRFTNDAKANEYLKPHICKG